MIRFGPSGNDKQFYADGFKSTVDAPKWVFEHGLNAYEYSFGRGINIGDDKACEIGKLCKQFDVAISVHAPYYINFANPDDEKAENSYNYILNSVKKLKAFGGDRVVFHPSSVGKMSREEAVELTKKRLENLAKIIKDNNLDDCWYCPETMGRINQIGDEKEIAEFCKIADFYLPTIDFGHLNARTYGALKYQEDFENIIKTLIDSIGIERTRKIHVHFSKIEYSKGGEVRHLTFEDNVFGPDFLPLAKVIKKYDMSPVIICESNGTQAIDSISMKNIYESL